MSMTFLVAGTGAKMVVSLFSKLGVPIPTGGIQSRGEIGFEMFSRVVLSIG